MDNNNTQNSAIPPAPIEPSAVPPKKSKTGLIIGLVIGGVVLFLVLPALIFGLLIAFSKDDKKTDQDSSLDTSKQQDEEETSQLNAKTAKYLSDFDVVCENGSISNATDFMKPYKVVAFSRSEGQVGDSWSSLTLDYDASYRADADEFEAVNVVACLEEKADTATMSKTCEFTTQGEKKTLDYYALQYDLVLREAQTGAKIEDAGVINGPATDCPMFVSYDENDPKVYAKPDQNALDAAIAAFAQ